MRHLILSWGCTCSGEKGGSRFSNMEGFYREKLYLLSRIPDGRTIGFRRGKKQSCSPRQGLHVGTSFMEFQQNPRGRGFLLLDLPLV